MFALKNIYFINYFLFAINLPIIYDIMMTSYFLNTYKSIVSLKIIIRYETYEIIRVTYYIIIIIMSEIPSYFLFVCEI